LVFSVVVVVSDAARGSRQAARNVELSGFYVLTFEQDAGCVPLVAIPVQPSGSPVHYHHTPPTLGEHTDEVFAKWLDGGALEAPKIIEGWDLQAACGAG
jgi:crotonobetainyl-CoA:carnitine CoA-transferase CaiB-like acyl-CoA transferase